MTIPMFAYDDHPAMMDELRTRTIADWIAEITVLRQVARAKLAGNDLACYIEAKKWEANKKWSAP